MRRSRFHNLITLGVVAAVVFFPLNMYAAEVNHNFSEFIHLDGTLGEGFAEGWKGSSPDLSPLDQMMKDFLADLEKPNTFLSLEEEEDEEELIEGGFWSNHKVLIAGGLLLTTGLLLGLLALASGGESSAAESASGGSAQGSPPSPGSDEPSAPQNLTSDPNSNVGDPDLPKDENGDLPAGGGGGAPGGGDPNNLGPGGLPSGNLPDTFFNAFLPSEANNPNPGAGAGGSSVPHSPEPSTFLLSALGLLVPALRRRKRL